MDQSPSSEADSRLAGQVIL